MSGLERHGTYVVLLTEGLSSGLSSQDKITMYFLTVSEASTSSRNNCTVTNRWWLCKGGSSEMSLPVEARQAPDRLKKYVELTQSWRIAAPQWCTWMLTATTAQGRARQSETQCACSPHRDNQSNQNCGGCKGNFQGSSTGPGCGVPPKTLSSLNSSILKGFSNLSTSHTQLLS